MSDVRNIRLYGHDWTPEFFQVLARSLRVKWMLLLNGLRWRLELRVQWHAGYLLKAHGVANPNTLPEEWQKDVEPPTRTLRALTFVPGRQLAPEFKRPDDPRVATQKLMARLTAEPRAKRYAHSRTAHVFYDLDPSDGEPNAQDTETTD